MSPPLFPALPGQGWSVHKKPTFSTRVASHTSGREVRASLFARALYEFELTFDGLDSSGGFPGLQSQSLQTLMGFFLTAQGQLNSFLYADPSDSAVTAQNIGTGNGSTTVFHARARDRRLFRARQLCDGDFERHAQRLADRRLYLHGAEHDHLFQCARGRRRRRLDRDVRLPLPLPRRPTGL